MPNEHDITRLARKIAESEIGSGEHYRAVCDLRSILSDNPKKKTTTPIDTLVDQAIIKGRIEAFVFMQTQLTCYADDNDEVMSRWRRATPANKERSKVFRSLAAECEDYANTQRKEALK